MENFTQQFETIYNANIKREGADKLLEYLKSTDFFTAPASTRFHSNHEGGLVKHTVKVYQRFVKIAEAEYGKDFIDKNAESLAVIALLHDICKVNLYKTELRNQKIDGQWIQKPYYAHDDNLPYGHGEKSVYMLGGFIRLTREEAMAINWHMGAFDDRCRASYNALGKAFKMYPLALLFHTADLLTSYLDEEVV